jgi:hypothetical protein
VSRIRWYLDEDSMPHVLVDLLRASGEDVKTAHEEGMTGRADEEHMDHAIRLERCVYTGNVADFPRIHGEYLRQGKSHFGIVVRTRKRWSPSEQGRRLQRLADSRTADEMRDSLEFLGDWS